MATASLSLRLNGGGLQSGGITAAIGDSVQLTSTDKSGWGIPATVWTITSYPPGFTCPAGWSTDADGRYYCQGTSDPPTFVLSLWGKYMLELKVLGGKYVDRKTALKIQSPTGLEDVARGEDTQFGGARDGNVAAQRANLRAIQTSLDQLNASSLLPGNDSSVAMFMPSGNAAADTALFETLLNTGKHVVASGTLRLTRPVQVTASGASVRAVVRGMFTIQQDESWSGTGNTSVDNCLIRIKEVENAAAPTLVTVTSPDGSPTLTVASAAGFSGKHFKMLGYSGASDFLSAGPNTGCPSEELLRAASVASNTITHALPQVDWHGANSLSVPYKQAKILDSAVDGFAVYGVRFDVYQQGQPHASLPVVAYAVSATFARSIELVDCEIKGFVGDSIYMRGCRDSRIDGLINRGACNGRFYLFSCQGVKVTFRDLHEVFERVNTRNSATWRPVYTVRSQSRNILVKGEFNHVTGCCVEWGGVNCHFDTHGDDIDFTAGANSQCLDDILIGRRGLLSDWTAGLVSMAEFGQGNSYRKTFGSNVTTGSVVQGQPELGDRIDLYHALVYMHDVFDFKLTLHGSRKGNSGNDTNMPMRLAITSQDSYGHMDVSVVGTHHCILSTGYVNRYEGRISWDPTAGNGIPALGDFVILDECGTVAPRWEVLQQNNAKNAFVFMSQMATSVATHFPLCRHFYSYPADNTSGNQVWCADDIYMGRFVDGASSSITRCTIRARYDDQTENLIIENAVANAGDGASQGPAVIVLSDDFSRAGTKRHVAFVHGGPQAVAPVVVAASTNPGTIVKSDANGKAVAHTDGASFAASLRRVVGRVIRRQTVANGIVQLG